MDHPGDHMIPTSVSSRDPVCGMEVAREAAEKEHLYTDCQGVRYLFCSLACFQVFQMDPARFQNQQENSKNRIGDCELCSKKIREGDQFSELTLGGVRYKFCCPTCASVYSANIARNSAEPAPPPVDMAAQLRQCGLFPWLNEAVEHHASDLFLTAGEPPTLKIYGVFKRIEEAVLKPERLFEMFKAILPPPKLEQFQEGREIDMGLDVPGCSRFRVNAFRHRTGGALAIRPLPYKIPSLVELGLPPVFNGLCSLRRGLILITGPAGSGKSTTLAAIIDTINQREERHIITIEDPIEYLIPNRRSLIHQREVGWHTSSFSDGLRNALRENPDVIVVGELRDLESISLAIRAAETGHLVLGTLHSGTAIQAITRLLDVFDAQRQPLMRVQLAQSLQAICAQRLLKRRDGTGMIVATEVMMATLAVRNIIRENRLQEIRGYMATGMREQMHTFQQSIQALIDKSLVDASCLGESIL